MFILHRLAEHFEVDVSEQEVNGRIASIAAHRGLRPDQVRAELTQTGRLSEVAQVIRQHKAADRVVAQAKVTDIPAADWLAELSKSKGEGANKPKTASKTKKSTAAKTASTKSPTKKKTTGGPEK